MHKSNFKAVEVRSAWLPFAWNSLGEYLRVSELIAYFMVSTYNEAFSTIVAICKMFT